MTAKEKAKELYTKHEFGYIPNYTSKFEVKECCLVVCDEMINYIDSKGNGYYTLSEELREELRNEYDFWLEVKIEVEKL